MPAVAGHSLAPTVSPDDLRCHAERQTALTSRCEDIQRAYPILSHAVLKQSQRLWV